MALAMLGYGGYQTVARPGYLTRIAAAHAQDPDATRRQELAKARKDDRTYSTLLLAWGGLMAAGLVLHFLVSAPQWKGTALGIMGLSLTLLLLDSTLQYRLRQYQAGLEQVEAQR